MKSLPNLHYLANYIVILTKVSTFLQNVQKIKPINYLTTSIVIFTEVSTFFQNAQKINPFNYLTNYIVILTKVSTFSQELIKLQWNHYTAFTIWQITLWFSLKFLPFIQNAQKIKPYYASFHLKMKCKSTNIPNAKWGLREQEEWLS